MEKTKNINIIYKGKVVTLSVDDVLLDDGRLAKREVVIHRGGCCIALRDSKDNKYYCVRQYRYALKDEMLEFCAGKVENNEEPIITVQRECEEELGFSVKNLKAYGYIAPSCGYTSEKIFLFSGDIDQKVGTHFDEDENIKPEKYSLAELNHKVSTGEIYDSKTIALLYYLNKEELNTK